jgi:ABC-type sugar transport system ATPase subunit
LKDISFDLHRGEVLGIAGLMGAGRTELLESLFGASSIRPTGTVQIEGKEVRFSHPSEAMKQGIALVTEDRKRLGLFPAMDVGRNISMCSLLEARRSGLLSRGAENDLGNRMVDKLKVKTAGLRAAITGLSGGNQQKCIVGRWLLTEPKILLLDDPTRGVDVGAKAELYRIIRELCAGGLGVIVTSSELPEVLTLSDRIMVLNEGRQAAMFDRKDATQDNIIRAATA